MKKGYLREIRSVLPTVMILKERWSIYKYCTVVFEWLGYWIGFGEVIKYPCDKCFSKHYGCRTGCKTFDKWMKKGR